tara:strand:- start:2812 stop:4356 length:1545 start_codon:yes stop_codon:yes gene_type:complete
MRSKKKNVRELMADPANVRTHSAQNLEAIAGSLKRFGQQKPIVITPNGVVVAGNGTLEAARSLGWESVDVVETDLAGAEVTSFAIADNRTAELAEWDESALARTLEALREDAEADELSTGFADDVIDKMVRELRGDEDLEEGELQEPPSEPITKRGDLWRLGDHRLLCGDSTNADDVARLFDGATATMIHADPPYGMGKEKDGVANDNLYREKLDAFLLEWWTAWRPFLLDNGSAYIWGNAEDLWRLWYRGGLNESERLTMRNEIVWNKGFAQQFEMMKHGPEGLRSYNVISERCLFFMVGEQGFNNNADNYWEGWEPIRSYLAGEVAKCGWTRSDVHRICGVADSGPGMASHWITKSQWSLITEEHYRKLQEAAREHDAFKREHDAFKREHDALKREHDDLKAKFYATRSHFDNGHDNMTDVWSFDRVVGEDRHGHATPKPIGLTARAIKSSSREGDAIAVPFGGTGPEVIAAEQLGRRCYGMEIDPGYCDVIVNRWESLTGKTAERIEGGGE